MHRLIEPAALADQMLVRSDLRSMVECLLTARYSESEIVDYLTGPLGVAEDDAIDAVRDACGPSRYLSRAEGESLA